MDVIALRKRSGTVSGEIRLNGYLQDPISFRRCSGYVEQFDVQSPELTVRETVLFSARLRLEPSHVDSDEKVQAFVDQILDDVELSVLANALVGSEEAGGLSFEQKKRLSIAVELAASPSILFLDEVRLIHDFCALVCWTSISRISFVSFSLQADLTHEARVLLSEHFGGLRMAIALSALPSISPVVECSACL